MVFLEGVVGQGFFVDFCECGLDLLEEGVEFGFQDTDCALDGGFPLLFYFYQLDTDFSFGREENFDSEAPAGSDAKRCSS